MDGLQNPQIEICEQPEAQTLDVDPVIQMCSQTKLCNAEVTQNSPENLNQCNIEQPCCPEPSCTEPPQCFPQPPIPNMQQNCCEEILPCNPDPCIPCSENRSCEIQKAGIMKDECKEKCCLKRYQRYIQPPRQQLIKPVSQFIAPSGCMEKDTIYKRSYYPIEGCSISQFRQQPIVQKDMIGRQLDRPDCDTTQKLSYQPFCCLDRVGLIVPRSHNIMGDGPVQTCTTQKHDYVPKPINRPRLFIPKTSLETPNIPLESNTTIRLSYLPNDVCKHPPPKGIKPPCNLETPKCPLECQTVQKLSYQPVCPPPKEHLPWANRSSYQPSTQPLDKETTYKLSYLPNCTQRSMPIVPIPCISLSSGSNIQLDTVYRTSYNPVCGERPVPIVPQSTLKTPCGPFETNTIYRCSYPGHCGLLASSPFSPCTNLSTGGQFQSITTQKHDYVPKPISRRLLLKPSSSMERTSGAFEKNTINKLSYCPPDFCNFHLSQPIRPKNNIERSMASMEHDTVQKLSYLPVNIPCKEIYPWAVRKDSFERPNAPMEKETIQKASYRPPGTFIDCCEEYCCPPEKSVPIPNNIECC